MKLARVRIIADSKNFTVPINKIINYEEYENNPSHTELYTVKINGRIKSCSILAVADSKDELQAQLSGKRQVYAKFNESDLIDKEDVPEVTPTKEQSSKDRKNRKNNTQQATKKTSDNIVKQYRTRRMEENKKRVDVIQSHEIETESEEESGKEEENHSSQKSKIPEREIAKEKAIDEEEEDELEGNDDGQIQNLEDRRDSIDRERESTLSNQAVNQPPNQPPNGPAYELTDSDEDEMTDLGGGVRIKESAFETAKDKTDPGEFVRIMSYGVWGYRKLADRCCRKQKNVDRKLLTPKKVKVIKRHFKEWLKKEQYVRHLEEREVKKIDKYIGGAITNARKKLARRLLENQQ